MRLVKVEAKNFMSYNQLLFTFSNGVWLITGDNGAGKSSIFEAITYAIYGKTRSDVDGVVKIGKECCVVRLEFEADDMTRYEIMRKRHLKHKSELTITNLNNKSLNITRPVMSETQFRIEEIIGFNYDMFVSSAYFGQEKTTNFMRKTPKERKELFSDMLGLGVYRVAEARAKDKVKDLTLKAELKREKFKHYIETVDRYKGDLEKLKYDESEKDKSEMEIHIINTRISSLNEVLIKKQSAYDKYNLISGMSKERDDNSLEIIELQNNVKEIAGHINNCIKILKGRDKKALEKVIEELRVEGEPCPTCGTLIMNKKHEKTEKKLVGELAEYEKYETKLSGLKDKMGRYEEQLLRLNKRNKNIFEQLKDGEEELLKLSRTKLLGSIDNIRDEMKKAISKKGEVEKILLNVMRNKVLMDDKRQGINEYSKRAVEVKEIVSRLELIIEEYLLLAKAFSRDGIPSHILENTLPELEGETNKILSEIMNEPFYIKFKVQKITKSEKIKDTFDLGIFIDNVERAFDSCSGGEKVRISIAIRLAISKLLSESTGRRIQFLLIDEIEYLDFAGLEDFVKIIKNIQKQFNTILIISHIAELKDMIGNYIIIKKDINGSKIA